MTAPFLHPTWPSVSEPVEGADPRVLSLGAGVESTTFALMAAYGEIGPMPDAAVFADTVALDAAMRRNGPAAGMRGLEYMRRSCHPLGDFDFEAETGGPDFDFRSECEGVCGT